MATKTVRFADIKDSIVFDFLQCSVTDMQSFFNAEVQRNPITVTSRVIAKALVDPPAGFDSPEGLVERLSYLEFQLLKTTFTERMNDFMVDYDINDYVTWDLEKPTARGMQRFFEENQKENFVEVLRIFADYMADYPKEWGDLSDVEACLDTFPFFALRFLYKGLNDAIAEYQKKL